MKKQAEDGPTGGAKDIASALAAEDGWFQDPLRTWLTGALGVGAVGGGLSSYMASRKDVEGESEEDRRSRILRQGLLGSGMGAAVGSLPAAGQYLMGLGKAKDDRLPDSIAKLIKGLQSGPSGYAKEYNRADPLGGVGNAVNMYQNPVAEFTDMNINPFGEGRWLQGNALNPVFNAASLGIPGLMLLKNTGISDAWRKAQLERFGDMAKSNMPKLFNNSYAAGSHGGVTSALMQSQGFDPTSGKFKFMPKGMGFNESKFLTSFRDDPRAAINDVVDRYRKQSALFDKVMSKMGPLERRSAGFPGISKPLPFFSHLAQNIAGQRGESFIPGTGWRNNVGTSALLNNNTQAAYSLLRSNKLSHGDVARLMGEAGHGRLSTTGARLRNFLGYRGDALGGVGNLRKLLALRKGIAPVATMTGIQGLGHLYEETAGNKRGMHIYNLANYDAAVEAWKSRYKTNPTWEDIAQITGVSEAEMKSSIALRDEGVIDDSIVNRVKGSIRGYK